MKPQSPYLDYAHDDAHMARYQAYQRKYAARVRESDRVLIDWIRETTSAAKCSLLDVGCSTGNLLIHIKHQLPAFELTGIDLSTPTVEANRSNPDLAGIKFDVADITKMSAGAGYDIIVCNAVFFAFDDDEVAVALRNLKQQLRAGGRLFVFDLLHGHDDNHLTVTERSREFPTGLRLTLRPRAGFARLCEHAGFDAVEFRPFAMPFDLPRPSHASDITSYTVSRDDGERLSFRGALYQPWCHAMATTRKR